MRQSGSIFNPQLPRECRRPIYRAKVLFRRFPIPAHKPKELRVSPEDRRYGPYCTAKVTPPEVPPRVVTLTNLAPALVAGTLHTIWVMDQET
jgi:hypothetical protein